MSSHTTNSTVKSTSVQPVVVPVVAPIATPVAVPLASPAAAVVFTKKNTKKQTKKLVANDSTVDVTVPRSKKSGYCCKSKAQKSQEQTKKSADKDKELTNQLKQQEHKFLKQLEELSETAKAIEKTYKERSSNHELAQQADKAENALLKAQLIKLEETNADLSSSNADAQNKINQLQVQHDTELGVVASDMADAQIKCKEATATLERTEICLQQANAESKNLREAMATCAESLSVAQVENDELTKECLALQAAVLQRDRELAQIAEEAKVLSFHTRETIVNNRTPEVSLQTTYDTRSVQHVQHE